MCVWFSAAITFGAIESGSTTLLGEKPIETTLSEMKPEKMEVDMPTANLSAHGSPGIY